MRPAEPFGDNSGDSTNANFPEVQCDLAIAKELFRAFLIDGDCESDFTGFDAGAEWRGETSLTRRLRNPKLGAWLIMRRR
jgi:hypothetical protein